MDRGEFIRRGFVCRPGVNGGWTVQQFLGDGMAAFSSFADMIKWLEDQHEGLLIGEVGQKGRPEPGTVYEWKAGQLTARSREPGDLNTQWPAPSASAMETVRIMAEAHEDVMRSMGQKLDEGGYKPSPPVVRRRCDYINCTAENPWRGCEIHGEGLDDGL